MRKLNQLAASRLAGRLRAVVRRSPRVKLALSRLASMGRSGDYEREFHLAMLENVRSTDCVWDVGANVGLYTAQFAELAGPAGAVIAFEPSPGCLPALGAVADRFASVRIANIALSDAGGIAHFDTSRGGTSVENQLSPSGDVEVRTATAADLVVSGEFPRPNVIKIDVEGFEFEVFEGLKPLLELTPRPRAIFMEIHFGILEKRGRQAFPGELRNFLLRHGYDVEWVDFSHISAVDKLAAQRPS